MKYESCMKKFNIIYTLQMIWMNWSVLLWGLSENFVNDFFKKVKTQEELDPF